MSLGLTAVYAFMLLWLRYFDELDLRVLERFMPIPEVVRESSLFS
jgi:hypothetical protein